MYLRRMYTAAGTGTIMATIMIILMPWTPTMTPVVGWSRFFSSHDGDSDCRLFDQASHGNAAPAMVALCLPMVLSSFVFDISRGEALARWAALFDARGPPLTS